MIGRCIFVIGGVGYVGIYMVVEFVDVGYEVVVIDNFVNVFSGE